MLVLPIFTVLLFFFLIFNFLVTFLAIIDPRSCTPNPSIFDCGESRFDCGKSRNVILKHPFRSLGDPNICRYPHFNLSCHNNRPVLLTSPDVSPEKYNSYYYVDLDSIDYVNKTIDHVIDPGLQKGNCSTLPSFRFSQLLASDSYRTDGWFIGQLSLYVKGDVEELVFVSCKNPVKSESKSKFHRLLDTATCNVSARRFSNNVSDTGDIFPYDYVGLASNLAISDIEESCTINVILPTQTDDESLRKGEDVSFHHIHNLLADGFQVQWSNFGNSLEKGPFWCEC